MTRIGGLLDYEWLARWHRPTDRETLAREAHRLAACGQSVRDIVQALRLAPEQVAALLVTEQAA